MGNKTDLFDGCIQVECIGEAKPLTIADVKIGQTFRHVGKYNSKNVYMVISLQTGPCVANGTVNVVLLRTGQVYELELDREVELVQCKLMVSPKKKA